MVALIEEKLEEVKWVRLKAFVDERGSFQELYRSSLYKELGIDVDFVQDNHSISKKGTIRGMHFQSSPGQAKLVSVLEGTIFDVYVDIRKNSPAFGKWGGRILEAKEGDQLFIPVGFAHGFAVLSDTAHVVYKVSAEYNAEKECTFRYDDPAVGIEWPVSAPILSEKDRGAKTLDEVVL
jgi:dTDP-4-dehydrorhamnose 3,5-epimerase